MGDNQQQQCMSDGGRAGGLDLPPGFRFHPKDEEIITYYLIPKVLNKSFTAIAMGEADLNKSEPWDLLAKDKMGEKEWYFYCLKDRKYPTGMRPNRATEAGYWKATGKDKEIYQSTGVAAALVGMKKTLVFYSGRAPKAEKNNWVMHEFRLDGSGKLPCRTTSSRCTFPINMNSSSKEWVVCRVFHKSNGVKKPVEPSFHMAMADNSADQRSVNFPMPTQFPMGAEDFTVNTNALCSLMDPATSFYSTARVSSSVLPALPPMVEMSSIGLQMATAQSLSVYQQMQMEAVGNGGFMARPDSMPTTIVLQNVGESPDETNAVEISALVDAGLASTATIDMDEIWKY